MTKGSLFTTNLKLNEMSEIRMTRKKAVVLAAKIKELRLKKDILKAFKAGISVMDIATTYNVTVASISKIVEDDKDMILQKNLNKVLSH